MIQTHKQDLVKITNRLIKRGSFDLNSDSEFSTLTRSEQNTVRSKVRFYLLQES
jgi:hypothetical protein